jgi:starch-binding outer membrane protein, SusD/RagB family
MKYIKILSVLVGATILSFSCTKLDENLRDSLTNVSSAVNAAGLLQSAYESMNSPLQDQSRVWADQEHTTDEALGPTRGPDWDDNGVWRVLHNHTWNADHAFLRDTYRELLQVQFAATSVLYRQPSAQQTAEARFIRALSVYYVLDGWDQVPYRTDLSDYGKLPITIQGSAAADTIISELTAVIAEPTLPKVSVMRASKDGARALLMKVYLNRGVYAKRDAPTFAASDMDQVIALADAIIPSYTINPSFFQTFAADNSTANKEIIYSLENTVGVRGGNNRFYWFCTLHYNQGPSGWNGFTTLADFYDKFEATDLRRGGSDPSGIYPGVTNVTGLRVGLLVGQQFNQSGTALNDRKANPLAFTRQVALKETGNNLEITGIRVVKYPPDFSKGVDGNAENELVIFRLSDVLLMKAEALLRKGDAAAALVIVNNLRSVRGATPFASLTLTNLLQERGREMYWESWRRNDMIRFGTFLEPLPAAPGTTSTRPVKSGPERLIFPIPNQQLSVNPNLVQNPGYQ